MAVSVKDISKPAKSRSTAKANAAKVPTPRQMAGRIGSAIRRAYGLASSGGYKVVRGEDQRNRALARAETGDEFKQLTQSERNRIIALARNLARNSEQMAGILQQFEVNVVGTVGGKAVFDFGSDDLDDPQETAFTDAFANWARECEFFEDGSLQKLLRLVLRTQILGGDVVLVFDDGLVEDSGQIIAFEPDCIGNIDPGEFKRRFPGYTQQQGIVKNANSKTVGVIVSWSQRGKTTYDLTTRDENGNERMAAWPLVKEPGVSWRDSLFTIYRSTGRFNQGHGSSSLWSALATLCDLTDLQGYEIQAAKKNSQTIGQVTKTDDAADESEIAAEYNPDAQAPICDGDTPENPASAEEEEIDADFDVLKAAGCIYELMPKGVKMELFDTKHPNASMPNFIEWLQRSASWSKGLTAIYATGKSNSSYSGAMAEMLLAEKTFDDEWHRLETGVLDWLMPRWYAWAKRKGLLPTVNLPDDWTRKCVVWERPVKRAINPVDEQSARSAGLRNHSINYVDFLGASWKRRLAQSVKEKKLFEKLGILYFPETDNNGMNNNQKSTMSGEETSDGKENQE